MSEADVCYSKAEMQNELRQAEILSNLIQYSYDSPNNGVIAKTIPLAIILSQDCDLLRDYEQRALGNYSTLNQVLLYEVEEATVGRIKANLNAGLWRPIAANQSERYHFLSTVTSDVDLEGLGLPELLIDFRRYFTIGSSELERQIGLLGGARRRCALVAPYREHLQTRAAFYFQRVTLPSPHLT